MQEERMTLEKAKKHRQTLRWWHNNSNYIAAAGVFLTVTVLVVVLAVTMTTKGGQQAQSTAEMPCTTDIIMPTAGAATILEEYQSQSTKPVYESMIRSRDWDAHDAELLLKIAMAEAEGESTEGKAMVMLVVLNRTWSKDFPNSIEDVIFQDDPARQFSVTKEGGRWWTTTPNEDCVAALELVESGWDNSWGALYFESGGKEDTWHGRNLDFLFQLGNHKFYK